MSIYNKQVSIKDITSNVKDSTVSVASFAYNFSASTVVNGLTRFFSKIKPKPKPKTDIKAQLSTIFKDMSDEDMKDMTMSDMHTLLIGIIPVPSVETITVDSTTGEILEPDQSSTIEETKEQIEAQE